MVHPPHRLARLVLPSLVLLACLPCAQAEPAKEEALPRGVTAARYDVTINSVIPGRVDRIACTEGQTVPTGRPLVMLDSRGQEAAVAVARIEAEDLSGEAVAAAKLELARIELAAQKRLLGEDSATRRDVDRAIADEKEALAQVDAAKAHTAGAQAKLKAEQVRLDQHAINAPFTGIVAKIQAQPGQVVGPETPVVRLVCLDPLRVEIHVPTAWAAGLKPGQTCKLKTDPAKDETLNATLIALDPVAEVATGTRRALLEIPNPDLKPAGMMVWLVR